MAATGELLMDLPTMIIIYTMHTGDRWMTTSPQQSTSECLKNAKQWRRHSRPSRRVKRTFVYCSTRYAIGPLAKPPF